jgi:diguanylate cyclase (GGDEF)-like protein
MPARISSLFAQANTHLSIGAKLALVITVAAFVSGGFVAWSVFRTQSAQIRNDFEERAFLIAHAFESATANEQPATDEERLTQLAGQQNRIQALAELEPVILLANIYARNGDEPLIVGTSEQELLGTVPAAAHTAEFERAMAGATIFSEEEVGGETAYELVVPLTIEGQPPLVLALYLSTKERDAALFAVQRTFARTLLVSVLAAVVVLYGATWILVSRRLRNLTSATHQMRRGDYGVRLSTGREQAADEIERLSADFNAMAQAIQTLHAQTSHLASTDPLTGLANRRAFQEALEREVAQAGRDGLPLATAILDLDGFKEVNDRYGHTVGDAALLLVARALTEASRAGDVTARFGGDEFVIALPNCDDLPGAMERIRIAIDDLGPPGGADEELPHVTVSAGGTLYQRGDTADALIQRADLALFQAKRNGRNQVSVAA